jgi:hypothetical protein
MNDGELGWQQNTNNICQGVATPFAAWLLAAYPRRGLGIAIKMSATLLCAQCLLFSSVVLIPLSLKHVAIWWQPLAISGSVLGGVNNALFQASTLHSCL